MWNQQHFKSQRNFLHHPIYPKNEFLNYGMTLPAVLFGMNTCMQHISTSKCTCPHFAAILPEDIDDSCDVSLNATDESLDTSGKAEASADSKFQMKAPVEEDFDYIKQISNGAYGYE